MGPNIVSRRMRRRAVPEQQNQFCSSRAKWWRLADIGILQFIAHCFI